MQEYTKNNIFHHEIFRMISHENFGLEGGTGQNLRYKKLRGSRGEILMEIFYDEKYSFRCIFAC